MAMDIEIPEKSETVTVKPHRFLIVRILISLAILAIGVLCFIILAGMKEAPAETPFMETSLQVDVSPAVATSLRIPLSGLGEVRSLNVVAISAEVTGSIIYVHPRLEPGYTVGAGEIMFKIDPREYQAVLDDLTAALDRERSALNRLELECRSLHQRLAILKRNRELARAELARYQRLLNDSKSVSQSSVEAAERDFNSVSDQFEQFSQTAAESPLRLEEARQNIKSLQARLEQARINLDRCVVRAPYEARIKDASLEVGQFVTPGTAVITLVDDINLEIRTPLDFREAEKWMPFLDSPPNSKKPAWFRPLKPVKCTIRWTENPEAYQWTGILDRVVDLDTDTRTITVAVRIHQTEYPAGSGLSFPLVQGMFCQVEIPGRMMAGVVRIPRSALAPDQTVYVAENGRLKTRPVKTLKAVGTDMLIEHGLQPNELVITTRLIEPMENAKLDIQTTGNVGSDTKQDRLEFGR
ncbi:MAG: HlyD family efflux transporter periplasmic adaptor subunit [Proteobacteria bacterium]|nr:HlyD family efflux transporter periplasmic adaptor subunit [Pseudomonadota bacterium]